MDDTLANMTVDQVCRNALGIHMCFWNLGFESDDLYIIPDSLMIHVVLRTQGKQFAIPAGPAQDETKFRKAWLEILAKWNSKGFTREEAQHMLQHTGIPQQATQFVFALQKKGFVLPAAADVLIQNPKAQA
jgi:hypothetical protein